MAGSCIGVILLVMSLEALRRASREYDAYIGRQHAAAHPAPTARVPSDTDSDHKGANVQATPCAPAPKRVMPTLLQQMVRSVLHMAQFAVAYIVGTDVADHKLLSANGDYRSCCWRCISTAISLFALSLELFWALSSSVGTA
jgi:hypothetical protein